MFLKLMHKLKNLIHPNMINTRWLIFYLKNQRQKKQPHGIFITGRIIGTSSYNSSPRGINSTSTGIGAAMMLAGVVAMITSVPFFLSSGTNKKEANLIFRNESESFLRFHNKANVFSVGVNLRL
jgi:hypothetical protein